MSNAAIHGEVFVHGGLQIVVARNVQCAMAIRRRNHVVGRDLGPATAVVELERAVDVDHPDRRCPLRFLPLFCRCSGLCSEAFGARQREPSTSGGRQESRREMRDEKRSYLSGSKGHDNRIPSLRLIDNTSILFHATSCGLLVQVGELYCSTMQRATRIIRIIWS